MRRARRPGQEARTHYGLRHYSRCCQKQRSGRAARHGGDIRPDARALRRCRHCSNGGALREAGGKAAPLSPLLRTMSRGFPCGPDRFGRPPADPMPRGCSKRNGAARKPPGHRNAPAARGKRDRDGVIKAGAREGVGSGQPPSFAPRPAMESKNGARSPAFFKRVWCVMRRCILTEKQNPAGTSEAHFHRWRRGTDDRSWR